MEALETIRDVGEKSIRFLGEPVWILTVDDAYIHCGVLVLRVHLTKTVLDWNNRVAQ